MSPARAGWEIPTGNGREGRSYNFSDKIMWKSICIWAVVQWWMREIFLNWKIKKFSIPRTSFVVLGNLLGKTPIFQALRYWKILFSPSDFEPTSVRNCQFLTLPVRNCQHADPYQVLGLERSEQQWMSPRVNPGGIAKQLPPGWKSTSVSELAVKKGKHSLTRRYAISLNRGYQEMKYSNPLDLWTFA